MGTVFKKHVTRPLPAGACVESKRRRATAKELRRDPEKATVVESVATWRDRTGARRSAVVRVTTDGSARVRVSSSTYYAKYRDGDGIVREVPTGCRDVQAARAKLAELERTAEKIRAGSLTTRDVQVGAQNQQPLLVHIDEFVAFLRQERRSPDRVNTVQSRLRTIAAACGFQRLRDMQASTLSTWLAAEFERGRSAAALNGFIETAVGFGYWLTGKRVSGRRSNQLGEVRLPQNPFAGMGRFNVDADRRRQRRALSEPELLRLLYVARWRPLAEFGRDSQPVGSDKLPANPNSRKTWSQKPLTIDTLPAAVKAARERLAGNPTFVAELERLGQERALVYKLAVLTGLRRGEIEVLTVGHCELSAACPMLRLESGETKNRQAADIPLRSDLATDLRTWLESMRQDLERVEVLQLRSPDASPAGLSPGKRLFAVSKQAVKVLDRDLAVAGIAKRDDRGRTVDFHSLRHSFGTLLSKGGVAPRTAQQAMRHSDIGLTMNVYTDPRLLDVAGAMESLPSLPLPVELNPTRDESRRATGTTACRGFVAPTVAPAAVSSAQNLSVCDSWATSPLQSSNEKTPRETGFSAMELKGVEPSTSSLRTKRSPN